MRCRHLALVVALTFAACESDRTAPDADAGPEPVGIVSDDGGTVETSDGAVQLTFPAGAVSGDTEITVEPAADVPDDAGLVPGTAYDFGPDGTRRAGRHSSTTRRSFPQASTRLPLHKADSLAQRGRERGRHGRQYRDRDAHGLQRVRAPFAG